MGRGRSPCCDKVGLKKGPWTPTEDMKLVSYIHRHGHANWRALPKLAGLLRCGKSCRLRWINYLRPNIKHGNFTAEEEETIIKLHALLGNKWSKIAARLPGRTDNEIKNVWNTHLKKRAASQGVYSSTLSVSSCNQGEGNGQPMLESESSVKACDRVRMEEKPETLREIIEIPVEPTLDIWDMLDDECSDMSQTLHNKDELFAGISLAKDIAKMGPNCVDGAAKSSRSSSSSSSYISFSNQFDMKEPEEDQENLLVKFEEGMAQVKAATYLENGQAHSKDIPKAPVEPNKEFWDMVDVDLSSLTRPREAQEAHQYASSCEDSKPEVGTERWIKYLESQLGLWDPTDVGQHNLMEDAANTPVFCPFFDGRLEAEFDPAITCLHPIPFPSTVFSL